MSYHANPAERSRLTAGLRELAEFLDQNPQVPAPRSTDLLVFPPDGTDAHSSRLDRRDEDEHLGCEVGRPGSHGRGLPMPG
jgi:hypothetical protein